MKPTRLLFSALLFGTATVVLSCRQPEPTAPELQIPALQASAVYSATGLVQCRPLAYDSVSRTIGAKGGTIRVSKHVLVIPDRALSEAVRITVVAPSDTVNRIQFQPEGLVFQLPVSLTMSYANCNIGPSARHKEIAYTNDSLAILEYVPSLDDPSKRKVTGQLSHFSWYAISW